MNIPTAKYHAKTLSGFEELVAEELKRHGAIEIVIGRRGVDFVATAEACLLYTSPSPRDRQKSRMPSSA